MITINILDDYKKKECTKCGEVKGLVHYHYNKLNKLYYTECIPCVRDKNNSRYKTKRGQELKRLNNNKRTYKQRYARTRANAERRSKEERKQALEFTISLEQYTEIVKDNKCYYCDGPLPATVGGLDRVDNDKGYTYENVIPCCTMCNQIRGKHLTVEEMKAVTIFLKEYRDGKNRS